MKNRKIMLAAVLCAALALTGCNGGNSSSSEATVSSAAGTADENSTAESSTAESGAYSVLTADIPAETVVASAGNGAEGMDITFAEFVKEYRYYLWQYGFSIDTDSSVADKMKQARQDVIDGIIKDRIVRAKFAENGLSFTDEEKQEIQDSTDSAINDIITSIKGVISYADSSLSEDELTEKAQLQLSQGLSDCGLTTDDLYGWQEVTFMAQKLRDKFSEGTEVTDEELESKMTETIDSIKKSYEDEPASFYGQYYSNLWLPEGTRAIQAILVGFDYDTYSEINTLRTDGKDDEADKLREESLPSIQERYDALMEKVNSGEDFAQLMTDNNDDEGNGLFIVTPGTEIYGEDFYNAAMGLENTGDTTSVLLDYGWYILRYQQDAEVTDEDLEKTRASVRQNLLASKKSELYNTEYEKWAEEYAFTTDNDVLDL